MRFSVQILCLMLSFVLFTMRSYFTLLTFQKRRNIKFGHFRNIPLWYILSLKPKGKGDCKIVSIWDQFHAFYIFFI